MSNAPPCPLPADRYISLRVNDARGEEFDPGQPSWNTTPRAWVLWDHGGYATLEDAAAVGDDGVAEAFASLCVHRGPDDPIIVRENVDGFGVVTHG